MSIFSKLFGIFLSDPNNPQSILKQLKKDVKKENPMYINPSKNIVYKALAIDIYQLYSILIYLQRPLLHLFSSKEIQTVILNHFLKEIVPKQLYAYLYLVINPQLDEIISKYGFEKTNTYYQKIFQIMKKYLTKDLKDKIDIIFEKLKQLEELCSFNYASILSLFDPTFTIESLPKTTSGFKDIKISSKFIQQLDDLAFLISNINLDDTLFPYLSLYIKKFSETNKTYLYDQVKLKKEFSKLIKLLINRFTPYKFEKYLQILKEDITYKIKLVSNPIQMVDSFLNRKIGEINNKLSTLKINEETVKIKKRVELLFQDVDIIKSQYYNDTISSTFVSASLTPLTRVTEYEILKTFTISFWEGKIRPMVSDIIFKGSFVNEELQAEINNMFHESSSLLDLINKFEESAIDLGKYYSIVLKKSDQLTKTASQKNNILMLVDRLNKSATSMISESKMFFQRLYACLKILLDDFQNNRQNNVSNLHSAFDVGFIKTLKIYAEKINLYCQTIQ